MIKVFLVEDEIIVREGIKNNIDWTGNGFIFCGEVSDGELAYPMIQKLKPDVVITDIRMPCMDGLELGRLIKKEMPNVKIIILSGYGEFEYAKEAIGIGITEYLLKPISGAEILKCMKSVREIIMKEQEEQEFIIKYKHEMMENEIDEKRKLFFHIIHNSLTLAAIIEKGNELNLELSSVVYNIMLLQLKEPNNLHCNSGYSKAFQEIQKQLFDLFDDKNDVIRFDCYIEGMVLLFKGDSTKDIKRIQEYYVEKIQTITRNKENILYFGGIGKPVSRLGELSNSYNEASRAFAYRYLMDISEIVDYEDIKNESIVMTRDKNTRISDVIHLDKKRVERFLKSGEKDDIHFFVYEYLKSIGNDSKNSLLFRQYLVIDMYYIVVDFLDEYGYDIATIEEPLQDSSLITAQTSNYSRTLHYIEKLLNLAIDLRDEFASKNDTNIIQKAKEYILKNYASEDISLNLVAASVYISPSHFSALFSQKTGQTFIKYLTDLRMDKAKELLKCTNLKTSEIGYLVGYKDPHYFSYIFKKTQNYSPKQFRIGE